MIESFQRKLMPAEMAAEMNSPEPEENEILDPRVLSSVLISLKLSQTQDDSSPRGEDPHSRLLELMHSTPMKALLDTATLHAQRQSLAPHEALQQILGTLQEIDKLWNMVLMKEGLARLSSQYH